MKVQYQYPFSLQVKTAVQNSLINIHFPFLYNEPTITQLINNQYRADITTAPTDRLHLRSRQNNFVIARTILTFFMILNTDNKIYIAF